MSRSRSYNVELVPLSALAACALLAGCTTEGKRETSAANRGEMTARLAAAAVAAHRTEARIQADQYDLGLREAAISASSQTPDEEARQRAAAVSLSREMKELRRNLKNYSREQKRLRAQLGMAGDIAGDVIP